MQLNLDHETLRKGAVVGAVACATMGVLVLLAVLVQIIAAALVTMLALMTGACVVAALWLQHSDEACECPELLEIIPLPPYPEEMYDYLGLKTNQLEPDVVTSVVVIHEGLPVASTQGCVHKLAVAYEHYRTLHGVPSDRLLKARKVGTADAPKGITRFVVGPAENDDRR